MKTIHYVEFFYPGILTSESSSRPIESREMPVNPPERAFGYRFFDRVEGTHDGETLVGDRKNFSPSVYIGKEYSAEEYLALPECNAIARDNITGNGYKRLCKTKFGQLIPIDPKDKVIPASPTEKGNGG